MNTLADLDIFTASPFRAIRNVGYYKQKNGWTWDSLGDYACLYCVAEGSVTLIRSGERQRVLPGGVIFLRSADHGAILAADGEDCAYYFLSFYYDESVHLGINPVVEDAAALEIFKEVRRAHLSEAYLYRLKTTQLFLGLVHHLATISAMKSKDYSGASRLHAATEYVNMNYYKKITIRDLCTVTNYSPAHLRRLFLKHYELTPQEYILQKKLTLARDMLIDAPEKNLEEIADLLSFCSASHLCKLFKRHYGMTILRYKRLHAPSHH